MATTSPHRPHPARTLAIFLLVCCGLVGLMAVAKQWTPRLGLDLRGGTTITLTARNSTGSGSVSADSLEQARTIIQQRVDSLGVGESEVTTEGGTNIVVSVPNANRDELVSLVGQTAQLSFRMVNEVGQSTPADPATASPSASPSGSSSASASPKPSAPGMPTPAATPTPVAPGLPTAPAPEPTPRPTAPGKQTRTVEQLLAWQPSAQDTTEFQTWQCGDPFPDVADQPLFACDAYGQKYLLGPVVIPGTQVNDAASGIPQQGVGYVVTLDFNGAGTSAFTKSTTYLAQQASPKNQFAIVLDQRVISAPSVSSPIPGGKAEISGQFTAASSAELANVLKYGALPLAFDISSVENISATLGGDQLHAGLIAGAIGLALVLVYSMIYYRALSIVVVGTLVVAGGLTYTCMVLLGAGLGLALNLPGIAGAIVAIGVTADSFIIYFERIRDEVRDGRALRSAIESGWTKARGTVVIADIVSLLSATVLFVLAIGSVKGFAFTLGLTTLIDLAIVFFFTKPLMTLLGRTRYFGQGGRFSGLDPNHMGVTRESLLGRRTRRIRKEA
ncbi:protein translocase subunit SecD [Aestuariimicrobium kwangyangense]|uniref:protein translocase subunit SecD n=1 Tax=Aestuariimicrobium kwangyangense TaxID=396389 RepID=UPI0003B75921|nr:protein translocase subunit SecD [Aestuariimicrobium kwangyangense]